jgi:O-antigen/teichoic acid export membrane protein
MNIVNQAKTGVIWGLSTKIINQILSWIVTIWVIRILAPEDFAIIALNDLSIGLLLVIGKFGFKGALLKAKTVTKENIDQLFTWLFLVNAFIFIVVQLLAQSISIYFENNSLEMLIRISSIAFLLSPITTISHALIYRNMLYKKVAKLDFIINICQISTNLILALLGYGFWALAIGLLVALVLRAVGYSYIAKVKFRFNNNFQELRSLRSDSNYSFYTGLIWELNHRNDIFLINYFIGTNALGVYRIGLSLAEKPVTLVGQVIQQIGISSFSKISHDRKLVGSYVVKASNLIAFVSFPIFLGLAAISPTLVPVVLGEKWIAAIVPLQVMCIVQIVNVLKEVSGSALFSVGKAKRKLVQTIIMFCTSTIAWYFGLQLGFVTGCICFAIAYVLWFVWHVFDTRNYIILTGFWKSKLISMFMSLCMFFSVVFTQPLIAKDPGIMSLILQIIIGGTVYVIIGLLFFKSYCNNFLRLLKMK